MANFIGRRSSRMASYDDNHTAAIEDNAGRFRLTGSY